jgi:anti-anti-sigma regulatory factor
MDVKIDTKERFTVITPEEAILSANMTAELKDLLLSYLQKDMSHLILNMSFIKEIDEITGETVASIQQKFYENNCSFVICELQKNVEDLLDEKELLELMNITPTESEAQDILQMEEIERELTSDDEEMEN